MTTFKELLDQCSWEDLEDFLYEFPDVGMDEGRWKMEGFRRMYDELRRMAPQASEEKIQLRKPREKGCDYPALFTKPAANSGYLSAYSWAEYLGQEVVPPKGMELPPAAIVAACMCAMSELGYTEQECRETYRRIAEPEVSHRLVARYNLDIEVYNTPSASIKRQLMQWLRSPCAGFDLPTWDEFLDLSCICRISFSHSSWEAQDIFSKRLEMIPKQLCEYRKFWIFAIYTDLALWESIQRPLQTGVEKRLTPQAKILTLAQVSQIEWDRRVFPKRVRLTILAGK